MDVTPAYAVEADGEDMTAALRRHLVELRVESTADRKTDTVEIRVAGRRGAVAVPPAGAELRVSMGYRERGPVAMGSYWHTETEIELAPTPAVVIRGTGANMGEQSALKTPRTHAWHDETMGAIVEAVAARHGLTPHVAPALAAVAVSHEDQTAESDMHFLRRLAVREDATAKVVGQQLVFAAAGAGTTAAGEAMPPLALSPASGGVLSARVEWRERPKVASVRAPWHDQAAAADRYAVAGSGEPAYDLAQHYPDEPKAASAARAALARFLRASGRLSATIPGTPTVKAGTPITTTNWPTAAANGTWLAERVVHTLSPTAGYTTEITATASNP